MLQVMPRFRLDEASDPPPLTDITFERDGWRSVASIEAVIRFFDQ
jgi:hypothetical protein